MSRFTLKAFFVLHNPYYVPQNVYHFDLESCNKTRNRRKLSKNVSKIVLSVFNFTHFSKLKILKDLIQQVSVSPDISGLQEKMFETMGKCECEHDIFLQCFEFWNSVSNFETGSLIYDHT